MNKKMTNSSKKEDRKKEPLQTGTANSRFNSHVKAEKERPFTVNVFFDGTGNNRYNTEARLVDEEYKIAAKTDQVTADHKRIKDLEASIKHEDEWRKNYPDRPPLMSELEYMRNKSLIEQCKEEFAAAGYDQPNYEPQTHLEGQASYGNELTNVALLFLEASDKDDPKIYIEGAGTNQHDTDDTKGLGFAAGEVSGVEARVNKAFIDLKKFVEDADAIKLTLNVFGFSRGAFYARVFCAIAKGDDGLHPSGSGNYQYPARKEIGIDAKDITINFVGLYDTVSSHGLGHYNDPRTFPLNIGKEREGIKRIVHLTAQNDYRFHFPLVSVTTALNEGIAFECSLPGAHSDLGGGYTDNWKEASHYLSYDRHDIIARNKRRPGEIHWHWWRDRGYYKVTDLRGVSPSKSELDNLTTKEARENPDFNIKDFRHIIAHRTVRHHYQYLSLNMMQLCAEEFGKLEFTAGNKRYKKRKAAFDQQKGSDPLLSKMDQEVTAFIEANYRQSGRFSFNSEQALGSKEDSQQFYHTYIHNSLQPSTMPLNADANSADWNNQNDAGTPQRPTVWGG